MKMKQHRTSGSSQDRQKTNKPSILLSQEENQLVFDLLGRKCLSMCTSIIQLYTTEPPLHSQWMKRYTGALCFVKDSVKRSYYCRLYCLMKNELIWEHEMYDEIQINQLQPYLLAFEGQENLVALNFAVEEEAEDFHRTVKTVIDNRSRRRQERKGRVKRNPPPRPTSAAPIPQKKENNAVVLRNPPPENNAQSVPQPQQQQPPPTFGLSINEKKKIRNKITKMDIGLPTNFKHITHVGWSAQHGFDLTGDDVETLKPFLAKAGVSDQQLNDRETRAFIYDFIQNHNVLDTVKLEGQPTPKIESQPLPPPPVPTRIQKPPPPPPTNRNQAVPPPLPTTTPPTRGPPPRPPPITTSLSTTGAPPPPPPPPMPIPPPPTPIANAGSSNSSNSSKTSQNGDIPDKRKDLMDSIVQGTVLKKVEPKVEIKSPRSDLLTEIRQGVELKPMTNRELGNIPSNRDSADIGTDALALALRRALQERGRVIHSSDEESNESSDNDGEWD